MVVNATNMGYPNSSNFQEIFLLINQINISSNRNAVIDSVSAAYSPAPKVNPLQLFERNKLFEQQLFLEV